MSDTIIVAILSLIGTSVGSILSVLTASKLTSYKIDELQKQVEKHNSVIERTYHLEQRATVVDVKLEAAEARLSALENHNNGGNNNG